MAFALGCVVFFLWLSMTNQYGIHSTGVADGRPLLSAVFGGVAWGVASFEPWGPILVLGFLAYSGYLYHDLSKAARLRRLEHARSPKWVAATPPPSPPPPATGETSPPSWQAHAAARATAHAAEPADEDDDPLARWRDANKKADEELRRRSLAAMRRATTARKKDKTARNEADATPLMYEVPESKNRRVAAKPMRHGKKLDVISFSYLNQAGEFSTRRVAVQMAGEWKFEGIDLDKGAERTFRYDSVIGRVTSQETGEIFHDAESWRDSIR